MMTVLLHASSWNMSDGGGGNEVTGVVTAVAANALSVLRNPPPGLRVAVRLGIGPGAVLLEHVRWMLDDRPPHPRVTFEHP